jgi:phosphoribosylformylglycinamidine synthase subunit PurQ / glutaminase
MNFGVVVFPGSNCDDDMMHVLGDVLHQPTHKIWHKEKTLPDVDCIILPGGFSYGDYLRCGAIARFSPVMQAVVEFANAGGVVFGICNGFQILCEAHLLEGALLRNERQKFICKNVHLKAMTNNSSVTASLSMTKPYKIPIAHAEGRYYADDATLEKLAKNDQILFKYCDANGQITEGANPNGALQNIAGICNEGRNVFGMMPHPERASEIELGNMDGRFLFESLLEHALVNG